MALTVLVWSRGVIKSSGLAFGVCQGILNISKRFLLGLLFWLTLTLSPYIFSPNQICWYSVLPSYIFCQKKKRLLDVGVVFVGIVALWTWTGLSYRPHIAISIASLKCIGKTKQKQIHCIKVCLRQVTLKPWAYFMKHTHTNTHTAISKSWFCVPAYTVVLYCTGTAQTATGGMLLYQVEDKRQTPFL